MWYQIVKTQLQQSRGFLPFLLPLAATAARALAGTAIASGAKALFNKIQGKGIKKKKVGAGYIMPWMVNK